MFRGDKSRGDAAAATWMFRGDESRRRRGCDVDVSWRRELRRRRGCDVDRRRAQNENERSTAARASPRRVRCRSASPRHVRVSRSPPSPPSPGPVRVSHVAAAAGEEASVDGRRRAVVRPSARPALPEDCARTVASFLSAKRALRAACVARCWRRAADHDEDWRSRVSARWPYPFPVDPRGATWRRVYERRARLEAARRGAGCGAAVSFLPRFCANPCCDLLLTTRRGALKHHLVHPYSWRHRSSEDVNYLSRKALGDAAGRQGDLVAAARELLER